MILRRRTIVRRRVDWVRSVHLTLEGEAPSWTAASHLPCARFQKLWIPRAPSLGSGKTEPDRTKGSKSARFNVARGCCGSMAVAAAVAFSGVRLMGHQQVTDAYLVGLAGRRGGVLATLAPTIASLTQVETVERKAAEFVG
jgi:hypothetical protein